MLGLYSSSCFRRFYTNKDRYIGVLICSRCTRWHKVWHKDGWIEEALYFIIKNKGISTEALVPYRGLPLLPLSYRGNPPGPSYSRCVANLYWYRRIPYDNERALLLALSKQPIGIYIDCSDFPNYNGGVFIGRGSMLLNHCMVLTGYGTTPEGIDFWIAKNSWGPEWGEGGFMRIERGIPITAGVCGVPMRALYPIVESTYYSERY